MIWGFGAGRTASIKTRAVDPALRHLLTKSNPTLGNYEKHSDPYKFMAVGDHFGRGQAPLQNQDHPSSELSTCLP